jgi:hypothetical protein
MELIDKSAVVAEIERRITDNKKDIERTSHKNLEDYFEGYEDALVLFKEKFLDTLEVKEVELEKAIDDYIYTNNGRKRQIYFLERYVRGRKGRRIYMEKGIDKSAQRALEKYPYKEGYDVEIPYPSTYDENKDQREAFVEGYHQAEKDLAMTIEDIERIHTFLYAIKHNKQGVFTFTRLEDKQYQEVLNRFNKLKDN